MYQSGKTKNDKWDPMAPAYGRYWVDDPDGRRRVVFSLGVCRTRSIAERKCVDHIDKLGVNTDKYLIEATSSITFKKQGEIWLASLSKRKHNPIEQTTINNRRYALDKWIYPHLGHLHLADVSNLTLKRFVEDLSGLAPSSIRDYINIAKAVVDSATDENGEKIFPRTWNNSFMDLPPIKDQRQPTSTCNGVSNILLFAAGQYRMLYALLAGCGPLRAGEALGLEIDKHISSDFRTLSIVQKAKSGKLYPYLKTINGTRQVDLCPELAAFLREFVGNRTSGLLFRSSTGRQLLQSNTLSDSLHPILDYLTHVRGGFNIFRRFRLTHVEVSGCPEALKHFWSGHAQKHVSERYVKLSEDRAYRLSWSEKIGMGFELPKENFQEPQIDGCERRPPVVIPASSTKVKARTTRFVYFIQDSNGFIKIGVSVDPKNRLADLQVSHPYKLTLLGTIPGGIKEERSIHTLFAECRVGGEWFKPNEALSVYIQQACGTQTNVGLSGRDVNVAQFLPNCVC